jgi:hypothetical protein
MIQYKWWLLDMTLVVTGDIYGALGFLLAGVYGVVYLTFFRSVTTSRMVEVSSKLV